jgi:arsenite oxidase small subunit
MDRRNFVKLCSAVAALAAVRSRPSVAGPVRFRPYARTQLVSGDGEPIKALALETQVNYVFHYPFVGTPALLLRLGAAPSAKVTLQSADGAGYEWDGGVGPGGAVVAYSAICSHQLSAVFRDKTFISFHAEKSPVAERKDTIVCCAHHGVYDPSQGGKVLRGPAPQPLTTIVLEHDAATDALVATGTLGGELFEEFFKAYRRELIAELGRGVAKNEVSGTTVLKPLKDYVGEIVVC